MIFHSYVSLPEGNPMCFPMFFHFPESLIWLWHAMKGTWEGPLGSPQVLASAADSCGWDSQVSPHLLSTQRAHPLDGGKKCGKTYWKMMQNEAHVFSCCENISSWSSWRFSDLRWTVHERQFSSQDLSSQRFTKWYRWPYHGHIWPTSTRQSQMRRPMGRASQPASAWRPGCFAIRSSHRRWFWGLCLSCALHGCMMYVSMHAYLYMCLYTYVCVCVYIYIYICVCVCVCVCVIV